jgi:hypothetical protein
MFGIWKRVIEANTRIGYRPISLKEQTFTQKQIQKTYHSRYTKLKMLSVPYEIRGFQADHVVGVEL